MIDIEKFTPLGPVQFIELIKPSEQTAGGLYLPEVMQVNYCEATIKKAGLGWKIPDTDTSYALSWTQQGWNIIIQQHSFSPLYRGACIGFVRDDAILGVVFEDQFHPLNDWVKVSVDDWEAGGDILVPEELQRRPRKGKVLEWGPGRLISKGELIGCRLTIPTRLQVSPREFADATVHWGPDSEIVELGREGVEFALIKADDLDGIEEAGMEV